MADPFWKTQAFRDRYKSTGRVFWNDVARLTAKGGTVNPLPAPKPQGVPTSVAHPRIGSTQPAPAPTTPSTQAEGRPVSSPASVPDTSRVGRRKAFYADGVSRADKNFQTARADTQPGQSPTFRLNNPGEGTGTSVISDVAPTAWNEKLFGILNLGAEIPKGLAGADPTGVLPWIGKWFPLAGSVVRNVYRQVQARSPLLGSRVFLADALASQGMLDAQQLAGLVDLKEESERRRQEVDYSWRRVKDIWANIWSTHVPLLDAAGAAITGQPAPIEQNNPALDNDNYHRWYLLNDAERRKVQGETIDLRRQAYALLDQPFDKNNLDEARQLITQAQHNDIGASTFFDATWSYTFAVNPKLKSDFQAALVEAEMQKGAPLEYWEVYRIKDNFTDIWEEIPGELFVDLWNFLPIEKVSEAILKPLRLKWGKALIDKGGRLEVIGEALKEQGVVKAAMTTFGTMVEPLPVIGDLSKWLAGQAVRSTAEKIYSNAVDVVKRVGKGFTTDEFIDFMGQAQEGVLQNARIGKRETEILSTLRDLIDEPGAWSDLVSSARTKMRDYLYTEFLAKAEHTPAVRAISDEGLRKAAAEAWANTEVEKIVANPTNLTREIADTFRNRYLDGHRVGAGTLLDDNLMVVVAKKLGVFDKYKNGLGAIERFTNTVTRWWTTAVLRSRPAWVVGNMVDSTFRYLISGGKLFDDLGSIVTSAFEKAEAKDFLMPADMTESMLRRELKEPEQVAEKLLRGVKPKLGPLSFMIDEWNRLRPQSEAQMARGVLGNIADRFGRGRDLVAGLIENPGDLPAITKEGLAGSVKGVRDLWRAWVGGWTDFNAAVEFTLRARLYHTMLTSQYAQLETRALPELMQLVGNNEALRPIVLSLWQEAGKDPEKLRLLLREFLGKATKNAPFEFTRLVPDDLSQRVIALTYEDRALFSQHVLGALREAQTRGPLTRETVKTIFGDIDRQMAEALSHTADRFEEQVAGDVAQGVEGAVQAAEVSQTFTGRVRSQVQAALNLKPRAGLTRRDLMQSFRDAIGPVAAFREAKLDGTPFRVAVEQGRAVLTVDPAAVMKLDRNGLRAALTEVASDLLTRLGGEDLARLARPEDLPRYVRAFLADPKTLAEAQPDLVREFGRVLDRAPALATTLEGLLGHPLDYQKHVGGFLYDPLDLAQLVASHEADLPKVTPDYVRLAGEAQASARRTADQSLSKMVQTGTATVQAQQTFTEAMRDMDHLQSRLHEWWLKVYPGPLAKVGDVRARAWEAFDELRARNYEAVGRWTEEALADATAGTGKPVTIEEMLRRSGITIRWGENGHIKTIVIERASGKPATYNSGGRVVSLLEAYLLKDEFGHHLPADLTIKDLFAKGMREIETLAAARANAVNPPVRAAVDAVTAKIKSTKGVTNTYRGTVQREQFWKWVKQSFPASNTTIDAAQRIVDAIAQAFNFRTGQDWYEKTFAGYALIQDAENLPPDALHQMQEVIDGGTSPALMLSQIQAKVDQTLADNAAYFNDQRAELDRIMAEYQTVKNRLVEAAAAGDEQSVKLLRQLSGDLRRKVNTLFSQRSLSEPMGDAARFAFAGAEVDGLKVLADIPNTSSIGASLDGYDVLPGVREVPLDVIPYHSTKDLFYSADDFRRVEALSNEIAASGEIKPLIVVLDQQGAYILEGGHRLAALNQLGKQSFPALVVIDRTPSGSLFNQRGVVTAAVNFLDDGRAILSAVQGQADVASLMHGVGHILRRQLDPQDLKAVEEWAGVVDGTWDRTAEEQFAKGFEKYLAEGVAPTNLLERAFNTLKQVLLSIYNSLNGYFEGVEVSPKLREVFDRYTGRGQATAEQMTQWLPGKALQLLRNSGDPLVREAFNDEFRWLIQEVQQVGSEGDFMADLIRDHPWWETILGDYGDLNNPRATLIRLLENEISPTTKLAPELAELRTRLYEHAAAQLTNGTDFIQPNPYILNKLGFTDEAARTTKWWAEVNGIEDVAKWLGEKRSRRLFEEQQRAWQAFVSAPRYGQRSIGEVWGAANTSSQQVFLGYLRDYAQRLRDRFPGRADDMLDSLRVLEQEVQSFGNQVVQANRHLLPEQLSLREAELARLYPVAIPYWQMPDEMQAWLLRAEDAAAQAEAAREALAYWRDWLVNQIDTGSKVNPGLDDAGQADLMLWGEKAVQAKYDILNTAMYGGEYSGRLYTGAVPHVNRNMLYYEDFNRFDDLMRTVFPFWLFPSRSIPFWMQYMVGNPWLPAAYAKLLRNSQRAAYQSDATTSDGKQLPSLEGYLPIPGTRIWFNPAAQLSFRYALPRLSQQYNEVDEAQTPTQQIYEYLRDMGSTWGFSFAPWITLPLTALGVQDANRIPAWSIIPQLDLIPPWVERDLLEKIDRSVFPNASALWNKYVSPEPSWTDYMIERDLLRNTLAQMEGLSSERKLALAQAAQEALLKREKNPLWNETRRQMEEQDYYTRVKGYFTGLFPKEWTDAAQQFSGLRDEINTLRDGINNEVQASMFNMDPDAGQRYQHYLDRRYNTPDGYLLTLYGAIRFTQTPQGEQLYGQDRRDEVAQTIHEDQATQGYYDALGSLRTQLEAKLAQLPIGADSKLTRGVWDWYFAERTKIEDSDLYNEARRAWVQGYKPDQMVEEHYRGLWMQLIGETRPEWDRAGGQTYAEYQAKLAQWQADIPAHAASLQQQFSEKAQAEATSPEDLKRTLAVVARLKNETTYNDYTAWQRSNDTPYDALNAAWKELYWNPYWEAIDGKDGYERLLAEQEFLNAHPQPPTSAELAAWVGSHYAAGQFDQAQLLQAAQAHGVETIAERTAPTDQRAALIDEGYQVLSMAGPGQGRNALIDEFLRLGGERSDIDIFYSTGGAWKKDEDLQAFIQRLSQAAKNLDLKQPSSTDLAQWMVVQDLNDRYQAENKKRFGDDIQALLARYFGSSSKERKTDFTEDERARIDAYYDFRDQWASIYPEWAAYYIGDTTATKKSSSGGGGYYAGSGGGGSSSGGTTKRKSSGGGGGGKAPSATTLNRLATQAFIAAGYRGTLNARDLLDASKLGKGGYGGLPWWPPELWTKWGPPPAGLPQALGVTLTQDLLAGPLNPDGQSVLKGMAARHPEWTAYLNTILNTGEANGPTRKR